MLRSKNHKSVSSWHDVYIDVHVKNKIFIRRDAWRMEMTCCSQGRVDGFCSIRNLQVMNPIFGHSLLSTTLSKKKNSTTVTTLKIL